MNASEIRKGIVLNYNGAPHRVLEFQHRTPGNLRAFVQARLRNLRTGLATEVRFSSTESVERVTLEQNKMQYLYKEGDDYHFMNTESYEMVALHADVLGEAVGYLIEGMILEAQYFEGRVVGVEVPMFVELEVKETTPNIKGAAVQNTSKPAVLETGLEIKVPPYIEPGNRVKIDTRTGEFVERA